jgi:hypothetical protein
MRIEAARSVRFVHFLPHKLLHHTCIYSPMRRTCLPTAIRGIHACVGYMPLSETDLVPPT